MAGELEKKTREAMRKMDAKDWDSLNDMATEDLLGVDEIMRRWTKGRKAILDGLRQAPIEDIRTDLRDIEEKTWGDVGLVTCWMEQDYTFNGKRQHVSAPTTLLFRRVGSDWKVALIHSVPMPEST
ncbi:MAG TPA: nuclear transport factor 2 family protein [Candidatus Limnocylindria bacterium]|jgi:ketosteroid isomerase-like protein|nr:nuclear transport factor 2 family protein [Candidatus Limnocylindria bacterium]